MGSKRRQSSIRNVSNHGKNDKTYVWVKLRDGTFSPDLHDTHRAGSNVANKKRGAPGSDGSGDDVWGWSPGYYSIVGADRNNSGSSVEEKDGETNSGTSVQYHFTLLGLDGATSSGDQDAEDFHTAEHTLSESSTKKLLESGDIVLANAWEGQDLINRLELGTNDVSFESEYDYSDSDEDDDSTNIRTTQINHLLDTPDETPPSNLIELTHLHEPSVVHALRRRYENTTIDMSNIYTDTGPILLAVNPFKHDESGHLYGENTVTKYRVEGEGKWRKDRKEGMGGGGSKASKDSAVSDAHHDEAAGGEETTLPPHVYAVADRTFRTMMTQLHPPLDGMSPSDANKGKSNVAPSPIWQQKDKSTGLKVNQSILVSGESGAGKTVTTKLLMAYLSKLSRIPAGTVGAPASSEKEGMSIERRVLESNPIMESFGNARTIRNDNSSRFGKYIEMKFVSEGGSISKASMDSTPGATLIGASIETYLLEKVRLVHQSPGERNYHIFYELFSMRRESQGEDVDEKSGTNPKHIVEKIGLLDYGMEDFRLINTSDTYDRRDGVSDSSTFHDMKRAMSIIGFTPEEITTVFEVTAALLHASNLSFERIGEVECALEMDNPHLLFVVDLLGITKEALNQALCYYEITIGGHGTKGGETHKKVLSMDQVEKGVEALIKATYGGMFSYLVKRINLSIAGETQTNVGGKISSRTHHGAEKEASIGILDIFGFESFQVNSFEQLCINYCNESLQQQFNQFVLHNEQVEYDREGIPWSFIEFPDNQAVLDLIDTKSVGILNILHDQCRIPGASDRTFALQMYEKCMSHERFEADSRQVAEQLFAIHHYAGLVEYDVEGFVEKTRDELPKSGSDLLLSSTNKFVKLLANILQPNSQSLSKSKAMMSPRSGSGQRPTVGIQFSSQLQSLRVKIDLTSPHYVRCLKPNNQLVPDHFDAALIADQLRCAGVIEAVRVSRLGYPQRFSHNQFIARYKILSTKKLKKKDVAKKYDPAKALVHSIMKKLKDQPDDAGIQVGKTKVFLKRNAYGLLEKLRRERIASATIIIQKTARRFICQKMFARAFRFVLTIQCFVRRMLATKQVSDMRQQHNSILIQRFVRKYAAKKLLLSAKAIALWCQMHQRGAVGRQRYNELNNERNAIYLQAIWRRYIASKQFTRNINAAILIQCARRCYRARLSLGALKSVARDFSAVVEERDRLKQEVITLRNEIKRMKDESTVEQTATADSAESISSERGGEKQTLRVSFEGALGELDPGTELEEARSKLVRAKSQRDSISSDRDDLKQVNKMLTAELNTCEEELSSTKKELNQIKRSSISNAQDLQSAKVVSTDTSQVFELKNELRQLKDINNSLEIVNSLLKEENSSLNKPINQAKNTSTSEPTHHVSEDSSTSNKEPLHLRELNIKLRADNKQLKEENLSLIEKSISEAKKGTNEPTHYLNEALSTPRPDTLVEKSPGAVVPSVCTSFTADMDMSEEEMTKLREENQVLRNQLELLRVHQEFQYVADDHDYDDSVAPDSKSSAVSDSKTSSAFQDSLSNATEYIGEAHAVPESVMQQIYAEVEEATTAVVTKTRAESESKIAQLEAELKELRDESEQSKRLAKYDLDDVKRVNKSLRADLEENSKHTFALEEELEMKCDEFDALTEDVDRFAETFAAQHEELQQLEIRTKKLLAKNEQLKTLDSEKDAAIKELETKLDEKSNKFLGSEIGKLWEEISRLKETPSSGVSASSGASSGHSHHRSGSSSSESSDAQFDALNYPTSPAMPQDQSNAARSNHVLIEQELAFKSRGIIQEECQLD